jgi:hypothetical protein
MVPTNSTKHASGRGKTICTSAVLSSFGIHHSEFHYAENATTVKNVLRRKGFSVRSRKSALKVNAQTTIGQLRVAIQKIDGSTKNRYYVGVVGHAMVLNGEGKTIIDTAPRKKDRRKVVHVSIVERGL